MPGRPCLYVLSPSHYCERARWALALCGIAHDEVAWAPVLHIPYARRLASGSSLPILQTAEAVIQGSDRILDWTGLRGGDHALERRFEQRIGILVRQYIYSATLGGPAHGIRDLLHRGVPPWQARAGHLLWPLTRRLMVRAMRIHPERLPEVERELAAELDWFDARLGDRDYLVGDHLGRADITAASLLAPLVRPNACALYRKPVLPPEQEAVVERWRERPGLRWVERVYAEHRGAGAA